MFTKLICASTISCRLVLMGGMFALFSCDNKSRVDTKLVRQEMYDRKIRRISQDDFVALSLRLGDSILSAQTQSRPLQMSGDFMETRLGEFPLTILSKQVSETQLGDGKSKKSQLLQSGLSALKERTPFAPVAQKLEDTAWAYCTITPISHASTAQKDSAFLMLVFNNRDLIRLMRIKGVGN